METIYVFTVVNGHDNLLLIYMWRQWQLHYKAVNSNIMIKFLNTTKQLGFGYISLVANEGRQETALLTSLDFVAHIRF